jgi:hypothetical protein
MSDTMLETVRDALTIIRLTQEVALPSELKARCARLAEAYLDSNLPKLPEKKLPVMEFGVE